MRLQPLLQLVPRHDAGGDTFEEGDGGILLFRRVNPPAAAVALHELEEAQEAGALVSVRHRVVADQVPGEHGGLLHELGVRLDAAIAARGSGESRPCKGHETVDAEQRLGRDAEDAFSDREVVGEIEVVDAVRYRASLSRIAWFSFMNRSSLFWNARSERFAWTCSVIARRTASDTVMSSTRAIASSSRASSSWRRKVIAFAM